MSEMLQNQKTNEHRPLKSTSRGGEKESQPEDRDASNKCKHPTHQKLLNEDFLNLMPAEYWENYLREKRIEGSGEIVNTEQANRAINEVFVKRLQELEKKAPNVLEAKVETYKDWVKVQQRVSEMLLKDFDKFEKAFQFHLQSHEAPTNYNFRRDIATLVKLIKKAFHYNNWSLAGLQFESMTPAFVMGLDENSPHDMAILEKLLKGEYQTKMDERALKKRSATDLNLMALAVEVAEKHDEINKLKDQLCALEDEIQKAQKKIKLKDDVINQLRLDLKNFNKFLVQESVVNKSNGSSIGDQVSLATKGNLTEDLMMAQQTTNTKSHGMDESLELVRNQLQGIFTDTNSKSDCPPNEAECLKKVFMKLEKDKNEAQERLKKLKENLLASVMPNQSEERNLILSNNDDLLIRAVQSHIDSINLSHTELSGEVQKLLIEKGETAGKLEALNNIHRINCENLAQLADLLSSLTNEPVNYEEIYEPNSKNCNPFCRAIRRIHSKLTKQIEDLTEQVETEKDLRKKREEQISELEKSHNELKAMLLRELNQISPTLEHSVDNRDSSPQTSSATET